MSTGQLRPYAKVYIGAVVLAGVLAIGHSFYELATQPIGWKWVLLAVLTLVSGSATVRLPAVPATITVSETFVFTSVLLFGPAAGTLTVTLDALVISFWLSRKGHPLYRVLFNVAALPVAMWVGAHLFFSTAQIAPLLSTWRYREHALAIGIPAVVVYDGILRTKYWTDRDRDLSRERWFPTFDMA